MRSQPPMQEHRVPSPMKLIQDYQQQQEDSYYQNMNRSVVDKPPIFKKGAQPQVSKASIGKYQEENNGSSSEDDELAIAQKWLNLRKQKIQKINEELNTGKPQQQQQPQRDLHESQRSEEPRKPNKIPARGSPPRRFEDEGDEVYEQIQKQAPKRLVVPKAGLEELNEEDLRAINRDWVKTSPGHHRGMRSDGFTSAQKTQQQAMADTNDFFKKRATSSASKSFNINIASPQRSGLVDINTMNMEDLIQLKQVLDQRLSSENRTHHVQSQPQLNPLEYSLGSGIKHIEKSQLSFISPTSQDFFEQPTYTDTTQSASRLQYSALRDDVHGGQPQPNYYARNTGGGVRGGVPAEVSSYERRGEYIDPSLMRDFDSIAYTNNPNVMPQRQIQSPIKILAEEVPAYSLSQQRSTGGFHQEDDERSEVDENLYEQKLREFLKVRERMLKTNKIKDQGVDIEDLLKSTIIESKRSNISQSATVGGPRYGHNQHYVNSPPSVKSVGRPENARLSSDREAREWMNNQDLIRQALQENIPLFANKKSSDSGFFKAHKLDSEAKTPDYGYTRSQASVKSLKYQESEPADDYEEEVEQLTDDFYDDKLFDLVEDIEQKESNKSESFRRSEVNTATSRPRNTEVDHEFNNLFNTVTLNREFVNNIFK